MASDRGTPPRKKDHILQVTILDVNDNPPVIESPFGYNVSVNEVKTPDYQQLTTIQGGPWSEVTHERAIQMSCWPTGPSVLRIGILNRYSPSTQHGSIFLWLKQRSRDSFFFKTNVFGTWR